MATISSVAVPEDPNYGSVRAMLAHWRITRQVERLQERNTSVAIREQADAADHLRRAGLIVATGSRDAQLLVPFARDVRELVDGDPLSASLVSPIVDNAAQMIQTDYRHTFGY